MKSSKWHQSKHPVHIVNAAVHKYDENRHDQEKQQKTPALSDLDKHFIQIALNKKATHNKGNYKENNTYGNKD